MSSLCRSSWSEVPGNLSIVAVGDIEDELLEKMIYLTPRIKPGVMSDINVQLGLIPSGESSKRTHAFVRGAAGKLG